MRIDPDKLYKELGINKKLVTDFFIVFSRFEYALKRMGSYAKKTNEKTNKKTNGWAQADWKKFAKDYDRLFNPCPNTKLCTAVEYLKKHPPKRQVRKDGKLDFKDDGGKRTPELWQILYAVKGVRNNLFHGGKFPGAGVVDEPSRDKCLLSHCLTILYECLSLNGKIEKYFSVK